MHIRKSLCTGNSHEMTSPASETVAKWLHASNNGLQSSGIQDLVFRIEVRRALRHDPRCLQSLNGEQTDFRSSVSEKISCMTFGEPCNRIRQGSRLVTFFLISLLNPFYWT